MNRSLLLVLITVWASGRVANAPLATSPPSPPADWLAWQAKRKESVAGTNGWTTLVGLHWLLEGRNSAGSDPTNHVVLPRTRAAANVGSFVRAGRDVRFEAAPSIVATIAGKPVQSVKLQSDAGLKPTVLQIGQLSVIVIERGERIDCACAIQKPQPAPSFTDSSISLTIRRGG
jgi:uncharacterized protein (DUF1684 family)